MQRLERKPLQLKLIAKPGPDKGGTLAPSFFLDLLDERCFPVASIACQNYQSKPSLENSCRQLPVETGLHVCFS